MKSINKTYLLVLIILIQLISNILPLSIERRRKSHRKGIKDIFRIKFVSAKEIVNPFSDEEIKVSSTNDYIELGSGFFGFVYAFPQDDSYVVKKELKQKDVVTKEKEMFELTKTCDNVVRMFDSIEYKDYKFLKLEKCDNDLKAEYSSIKDNTDNDKSEVIDNYLQLLNGLKCMHYHGVAHNDLKIANFLKCGDQYKLGDLGIASQTTNETDLHADLKNMHTVYSSFIRILPNKKEIEDWNKLGKILKKKTDMTAEEYIDMISLYQTGKMKKIQKKYAFTEDNNSNLNKSK